MGISDEDYAKALEEKRKRQAFELQQMKKELQKQKEEAKMAGLMNSLGKLIGGGLNTLANPHHQQAIQPGAYQSVAAQQAGTGTVHISHGGTTTTFIGGSSGGGAFTEPMNSYVSEDDLKSEAMEAPLSAIYDMWQMRWGGAWVKETDLSEDHFWRIALKRLMGANKLEKHNVVSSYSRVYRIIE